MPPTLKQLTRRHPEHKKYADHWRMLSALAEGGCAVDEGVKKKLFINPDDAEPQVVKERLALAPYEPIMGSIIMKLVSQLMRDKASYEGSSDSFWKDRFFPLGAMSHEDSDPRQSFHGLLTRGVLNALVQGKMVAQVDTSSADALTRAEQRQVGADEPYVILRAREDLWDWETDSQGLVYAKLHSYREYKTRWDADPIREHEFTIYQKEQGKVKGSVYTVRNANDQKTQGDLPVFNIKALEDLTEANADIQVKSEDVEIFHTSSGAYRFPVVTRTIPKPLWIADQLYDLIKSLFNHVAGGEWGLLQTNYGILKFTGVDKPHEEGNDNPATMQKAGNGYYWELPPGVDGSWLVRPGDDLKLSIDYQDRLKQKMLDIVHKIAETASNAYAMRMQSGESKKEGRRDLDILLEVYGEEVRGFAKGILDVASIARNETTEWIVEGFSDYNTSGLMQSLEEYLALEGAGIDSQTLKRESRLAIANKAVQSMNLSPNLLTAITTELKADSPFTLSADGQRTLIELAKIGQIAPEDLHGILQKAGILPSDMDLMAMLRNLGLESGLPQTNNPVLAGDVN